MTRWFWLLLVLLFARVAFGQETPPIPDTVTISKAEFDALVQDAIQGRQCMAAFMGCAEAFDSVREENIRLKKKGLCTPVNPWRKNDVWLAKKTLADFLKR